MPNSAIPSTLSANALRGSFKVQLRVLHALMMREVITRFGRHNLGVLWLVVEPMLFTVGVATLWSVARLHRHSPIPIVAFAVTGYSAVLMWRNSASRCTSAVEHNKPLLFHRNVQLLDVLLTRTMLEIGGATCSFIVLGSTLTFIGWMPPPTDMATVVLGWLMLAWFGASLAVVIGAGCAFSEVVDRLWHPAAYLLFPLSGAAFMVDWMPEQLQHVVLLLPMVHGTEMIRQGWFGNVVPTHYEVSYLATSCLVLTLAGLYLQSAARRRVEF